MNTKKTRSQDRLYPSLVLGDTEVDIDFAADIAVATDTAVGADTAVAADTAAAAGVPEDLATAVR